MGLQCCPFTGELTVLRGVAERDWYPENPYGTKDEFTKYYNVLPAERLQVCRTRTGGDPANTATQEFANRAEKEVISTSTSLENLLMWYVGSTPEENTGSRPKIRSSPQMRSRGRTDIVPRFHPQRGHGKTPKTETTFHTSILFHIYRPPGHGHHSYAALSITGFQCSLPAVGPLPYAHLDLENSLEIGPSLLGSTRLIPGSISLVYYQQKSMLRRPTMCTDYRRVYLLYNLCVFVFPQ